MSPGLLAFCGFAYNSGPGSGSDVAPHYLEDESGSLGSKVVLNSSRGSRLTGIHDF